MGVIFGVFWSAEFSAYHDDGYGESEKIGDGACVHDSVDSGEEGEDEDQGQEEEDLSGERQEGSSLGLSDGGEEVGTDGL